MKFYNYLHSFYRECVFTLDEMFEDDTCIKDAEAIEKKLMKNNSNRDIISSVIIRSFKFRKDLSREDRYNYVKGMIYSRQFINEGDIDNLEKTFDLCNSDKILGKSVFGIRNFTDDYDYEYYYNYLDNIRFDTSEDLIKKSKKIEELILKSKERYEADLLAEKEYQETISEESEEDDEEEEEIEEETFKDEFFNVDDLSITDRILFSKKYYPIYKEGLLIHKGIKEDSKEYSMVSQGMDDQFYFMMNLYENTYNLLVKDFIKRSKNLSLGI